MKPNKEKVLKMTELYTYLNKLGLCDQIYVWGNDKQYIFYHWNKAMSNLIPSIVVQGNQIVELKYPRTLMPLVFLLVNYTIENDLTENHKFVRGLENGERQFNK